LAEEKTLSSRVIFEGRAFSVKIDTIKTADNRETTREIVVHHGAVVVVPVDADGNILLVRQYRKAVEKELLEIPAGGIEKDESPEEAVRREMAEETGYLPQKIVRLTGFYSAPGFCTEFLHLYLATGLQPHRLYAEDTEGISVVRTGPDEVLKLIASGAICDAKSIAGLLFYLNYRRTP
jgi:ADP-ribose pyrophosphatase